MENFPKFINCKTDFQLKLTKYDIKAIFCFNLHKRETRVQMWLSARSKNIYNLCDIFVTPYILIDWKRYVITGSQKQIIILWLKFLTDSEKSSNCVSVL